MPDSATDRRGTHDGAWNGSRFERRTAGGSPTDPRRLLDIFAKQVGLPEFEVFDLVPVQGAALALPRPVALGGATELVPSGLATRAVIAQVVSDAVFLADGVIPAVVGDFDLVVRRSRLKPARLHQDVGGVDGWLLALDFGGHLRRFPRGHGDDMERVLDAVRLFDWSRFGTIGMADGHYSPPDLSARFRAHDALIYRPFHWQSLQRLSGVDDAYDSDGSGVGTRRIDHLILDAAASTDLCDFLTAVCAHRDRVGGVREWAFVDRAIGYLRRAQAAEGYSQFIDLIGAVEALFGEDGDSLTATLKRRWAALLGTTVNERKAAGKRFEALYDLRSKHLHGDEGAPDLIRAEDLVEANVCVRALIVRILAWLDTILASTPPSPPSRTALLRYLDAAFTGEVDEEAMIARGLLNLAAHWDRTGFPAVRGRPSVEHSSRGY
jgi:hypothetical protein